MKNFIQATLFVIVALVGGLMTSSCDPCEGTVCTDGYCSNGTCICYDGYEKSNNQCIPFNKEYTGENMQGIEVEDSKMLVPPSSKPVTYTIVASETDPLKIILKDFNNLSGNNVTFTINSSKRNRLIEEGVISKIGRFYKVSGFKEENEIKLTLIETQGPTFMQTFGQFNLTLQQ